MPVYKDEKRKTWTARFYYTDYTGARKQLNKRGFATQREAKAFEQEYLLNKSRSCDMKLSTLIDTYLDDMEQRIRASTIVMKKGVINKWIIPYLGARKVNEITPIDVRDWQGTISRYRDAKGGALRPTYLRTIHAQLSAIFNYAVKFYGLDRNPCAVAGSIGEANSNAMNIWTEQEFQRFISNINRPDYKLAFNLLFYGGFRCGEVLALYKEDLTKGGEVSITKSFSRVNKQDKIGPTKTPNSVRKVPIPNWLAEDYRNYCNMLFGLTSGMRIFQFTSNALKDQLDYYADKARLPRIRIHDLRHSSASMLIDMGASVALVAERLGDTMQMVMRVYAHLYPNRQLDVVKMMEENASRNVSRPNQDHEA